MKKIYLFKTFLMAFVLMLLGGVNASAEIKSFTIDFYDSAKLTSTSGTNLTSSNYLTFVKVEDGLTASNVVPNISVKGTVQYGKNGGLTLGSGTASSASTNTVTFSIGSEYKITKVTMYAAAYESGRFLLNDAAASSGKLGTKGTTIESITSPFVWENLEGITSLKITKDNGSGGNQKRMTVYRIICEYDNEYTPTKTLKSLNLTGTAEDIYVGDEFTHEGITITATWDDDTQTDVTNACNYSECNMSETGTQEITATYQEKFVKYNVNVKTIANTAETAYTPTEAIELIDAGKGLNVPVYVKGKVSSIAFDWTSTNGNLSFFISEDGIEDKFEFYQNYKGADNEKYATAEETPNIGDEVVGYGKLTKYNKTYEFASGNYIVSIERGKVFQYDESSCSAILDATDNVFPTLTNTYGTSVTYESSDKNVATIDAEGNITLVGVGTTTITATLDEDNNVTASYTLNVARAKVWDLSVNQTTTATEEKIEWVDNVATMTGVKGGNKTDTPANNYVGGVKSGDNLRTSTRFYANSTFSITPAEGITILKIEYFATTEGYANAFKDSEWTNATTSSEGKTATIEPIDGTQKISAKIGGTTGATKVIVYYTGEPTVENKPLVAENTDGYYATFSSDRDVVFTDKVIVYAVNIKDGKLDMTALTTGDYTTTNSTTSTVTDGYYVPANTGVLIEALDAEMTYYTAAADQTFASLPTNQLVAVTADGVFTGDANHKYYKLAYDDYDAKTKLGFYYGAAGGAAFEVKKGLAYLAVPVVNGSSLAAGYAFGGNGDDDTTGINGIENDNVNETKTIYNLQGQRVEKAGLRGIYIVNGKKVVLK